MCITRKSSTLGTELKGLHYSYRSQNMERPHYMNRWYSCNIPFLWPKAMHSSCMYALPACVCGMIVPNIQYTYTSWHIAILVPRLHCPEFFVQCKAPACTVKKRLVAEPGNEAIQTSYCRLHIGDGYTISGHTIHDNRIHRTIHIDLPHN